MCEKHQYLTRAWLRLHDWASHRVITVPMSRPVVFLKTLSRRETDRIRGVSEGKSLSASKVCNRNVLN